MCEQLLHLVGTTANLADEDVTRRAEMFPAWLCTALHSLPLLILEEIRTKNAMRINFTTHCHFCTMQRTLVKFMWIIWSPVAIILFIYIPRHMEVSLF